MFKAPNSCENLAEILRYIRATGPGPRLEREFPCFSCDEGEYHQIGYTSPAGLTCYECDACGHSVTFP